jgi:D-alanyl-D-alanine carboxypeptidase
MSLIWRAPGPNGEPSPSGGRADVDPVLAEAVEAVLGPSPYSWFIISAVRSLAVQAQLYKAHLAGGPVAAPPGKSAHHYGAAVDVCLDLDGTRPGLQPGWDVRHPGWQWLRAALPATHEVLVSGWTFRRGRCDPPHIELRNWREPLRRPRPTGVIA